MFATNEENTEIYITLHYILFDSGNMAHKHTDKTYRQTERQII